MFRKYLLFMCVVVIFAGTVSAKVLIPKLMQAVTAPVIDGDLSDWNFIPSIDFNETTLNTENCSNFQSNADHSAKFKWMWDNTNLYIGIEVVDDETNLDPDMDNWMYDGVEIALCEADIGDALQGVHHGGTVWEGEDSLETKITLINYPTLGEVKIFDRWLLDNAEIPNVTYAAVASATGYTWEVAIPWAELNNGKFTLKPEIGDRITFNVAINDYDADGFSYLIFNAGGINNPTDKWWPCDVVSRDSVHISVSQPYCKKVMDGSQPVIDGNLDDWYFTFPVDINSTTSIGYSDYSGLEITPDEDASCVVYTMWDDDYFYLGMDAKDDVPGVFGEDIGAFWVNDGIEFMICTADIHPDSTHTFDHKGTYWAVEDTLDAKIRMAYDADYEEWRFIEERYIGVEYELDGDKVWFKTEDGFVIEARIPWDALETEDGYNWDLYEGKRVAMFWGMAELDTPETEDDYEEPNPDMNWLTPCYPISSWNTGYHEYPVVEITGENIVENFDNIVSVEKGAATDVRIASFDLKDNYPNPFNPVTNIEFTLDKAQNVDLAVYNLLGQKVVQIINNERMPAGLHRITFDAGSLQSGIYFYRLLNDEGLSICKKMALMK